MKLIRLLNEGYAGSLIPEMYVHDHDANAARTIANHEKFNVEFLLKHLRPDSNFVDAGGYEGYFSLIAATIIRTGKIFTYEPVLGSHTIIWQNMKLRGIQNMQLFHAALADKTADATIIWRSGAQCASSIFENPKDNNRQERSTVKFLTLDSQLDGAFKGIKIDVMKVDVEGGEVELFAGAHKFFSDNPECKVTLELHGNQIRERSKEMLKGFLDYIWREFNVLCFDLSPYPKDRFDLLYNDGGANLVLIHK